ncbi:esterase, partial [Enterococcus faecium]
SKTQRHMVQIPLMEEASTFLAKNLIKKYK